jgi:Fe2+ transport system protein FeoA
MPALPPPYTLEPGDVAVVAVPGSTDPELVAYLDTLGLRPGVTVEMVEKQPFDGPAVVRVDGEDRAVGDRVARQIYVMKEPVAENGPPPELSQERRRNPHAREEEIA